MDINGQNPELLQLDPQILPADGNFNILTFINDFDGTLEGSAPFLDGNQDVQVLDQNVTFVEVDAVDLLRSSQSNQNMLPNLEDKKESLYDVNIEMSLETLFNPGVDFQVKIAEIGKNDCYTFSNQLNKMFTSIDKPTTFEISFNPNSTNPLIVRAMLVCANMLYQPLSRCAYHIKNDATAEKNHVIVRRDGPVEYVGTPDATTFRDRLALKIPMGNSSQKNITLEFKCLSSCYKIKKVSTALVFTLEDPVAGQLLGRKVISVQISKNFKRDMETAEKAVVKRTVEPGQKRKQPMSSGDPGPSCSSTSDDLASVDLNLKLPPNAARDFLKYAEQFFAAKLYGANKAEEEDLLPTLKKIRGLASDLETPKDK